MPRTLHLRAEAPGDVETAAEILRIGGLVAFPTETVYGLGANALSPDAIEGVFHAKQRPPWDPIIVHVPDLQALAAVAVLTGGLAVRVQTLAASFWPGPLTLLLPRTPLVSDAVTAGRVLVGVRMPAHPVALELLRRVGLPLGAPSANRFGHTSPTTAQHVLDDLDGRIDAVLDAGPCPVGLESTVLDPQPTPMILYRAGAVTPDEIKAKTGLEVTQYQAQPAQGEKSGFPGSLPSPGVGLRHYAPDAGIELTAGTPEALWAAVEHSRSQGGRVGVLLPTEWSRPETAAEVHVQPWGAWNDPAALAANLFAGLRTLERTGVRTIVCPLPEPGGFRDALRDRLLKAAKPRSGNT